MNEKPVKLPMGFGEALARLARTPKAPVEAVERRQKGVKGLTQAETSKNLPRPARPSGRSR